MGYCPFDQDENLVGCFVEKDFANYFEFSTNDDKIPGFGSRQYPHKVWVNSGYVGGDQGYRYATVKKTVAYVAVDEDENGAIIEKWNIKGHREYVKIPY